MVLSERVIKISIQVQFTTLMQRLEIGKEQGLNKCKYLSDQGVSELLQNPEKVDRAPTIAMKEFSKVDFSIM